RGPGPPCLRRPRLRPGGGQPGDRPPLGDRAPDQVLLRPARGRAGRRAPGGSPQQGRGSPRFPGRGLRLPDRGGLASPPGEGTMGKVALITGASGALGRAIAERLGDAGYELALHYRKGAEEAHRLCRALGARGTRAIALQADICKRDEVERLVREAEEQLGPLDLVVNNAGLNRDRLIGKLSDDDWDVVLDTNLRGTFQVCRAVVEGMRGRKRGTIISISSIVGAMGN